MSKFNQLYCSLINESKESKKDLFIPLEMINLEWPRENSRDKNAGKWVDYDHKNTKARDILDETVGEEIDDKLTAYGAERAAITDETNGMMLPDVPVKNHNKIRLFLARVFKKFYDINKDGEDAEFSFRIKK